MAHSSRPHSLQQRLVWRTLGGIALIWAVVTVWMAFDARHELDELLDAHLTQTANLLMVQQIADTDEDIVYAQIHANKYSSNVAYQVFKEGELIAASANAGNHALATHSQGFATVIRSNGQAWRVFVANAANSNVRVYVAEAISGRMDIVWALLRGMLLPFAFALPLLGGVVWFNTRQSLLPIHVLRQRLSLRQDATLTPLKVEGLPVEVRPLQDTLNTLLSQLALRMDTERRFTADAAHELRTPIAAIRAQAQVALMAAAPDQLAVRQQALQDTIRGCDRANRVVEQLLTLSRLDEQSFATERPIDVQQVLQQVAADLAPFALKRNQDLAVVNEIQDASILKQRMPEMAVHIMFRNLLDNALRYTPDNGQVRVTLRHEGLKTLVVVFEDSGPGISQADMKRVGERFFRVLENGQSGSGLGWSIVQRIAKVHGLQVQLSRSQALGGLQVCLKMPSAT